METHHRAAIRAGLTDDEFWSLTPYRLGMKLQESNKARMEGYLSTGWFVSRFAVEREQRLEGLHSYIASMLGGKSDNPDLAEQTAQAQFNRMALQYGLEIETIEDEPEGG